MTRIEDFSQDAQDKIDSLIVRPFPDILPALEVYFGGPSETLTRNQVVFFEQLWEQEGPSTDARSLWNALRRVNERERFSKRRPPRREVVRIKGHRVVVYRDLATGRFTRRRRKA